jgi:hypothetical protein
VTSLNSQQRGARSWQSTECIGLFSSFSFRCFDSFSGTSIQLLAEKFRLFEPLTLELLRRSNTAASLPVARARRHSTVSFIFAAFRGAELPNHFVCRIKRCHHSLRPSTGDVRRLRSVQDIPVRFGSSSESFLPRPSVTELDLGKVDQLYC